MLIQSVATGGDDHVRFHKQVLAELYSKDTPPAYILTHSYGSMQMYNAMQRNLHLQDDGTSIYRSAVWLTPFFGLPNYAALQKYSWLLNFYFHLSIIDINSEPDTIEVRILNYSSTEHCKFHSIPRSFHW